MKGKLPTWKRYSQNSYLTIDSYLAYIKNPYNSIIKRQTTQIKMGEAPEQTLHVAVWHSMRVCVHLPPDCLQASDVGTWFSWPTTPLLSLWLSGAHYPFWSLKEIIRASHSSNSTSAQKWTHNPIKARERQFQDFLQKPGGDSLSHPSPRAASGQHAIQPSQAKANQRCCLNPWIQPNLKHILPFSVSRPLCLMTLESSPQSRD